MSLGRGPPKSLSSSGNMGSQAPGGSGTGPSVLWLPTARAAVTQMGAGGTGALRPTLLAEAWGPRLKLGHLGDPCNRVTMIVPLNLHSANYLPACWSQLFSFMCAQLPRGGV